MMRDERGRCTLCGEVRWCGRPCLNDPKKSNALLFDKDGRERTLRERGLGWEDPGVLGVVVRDKKKPERLRRARDNMAAYMRERRRKAREGGDG